MTQVSLSGISMVNVGLRKQLFVDDFVVLEKQGVSRELGTVTKANDGKPIHTDGWFYGTVLYDAGRFKMWLRSAGKCAYAESQDGIRFEKKAEVAGIPFAGEFTLSVEIDPHENDPQHRYKAVFAARGMAAGLAHSEDGIHWTPYNDGKPVTFRSAATCSQVLWDEDAKVYRLFTRTDFGRGGGPLARTAAQDFEVRGTRCMTNPDVKTSPTDWKVVRHWYLDHEGPQEYKRRQVYSLTDWIYHGVHFGLLSVYEWPADISEGIAADYTKRHERDVMNLYIGTSRDADNWDLQWVYAGKPIIPRGPDGAFDKDIVLPSLTVVTYDDKHWLYYGGANERHGTVEIKPPVDFERQTAIGLATLRLDGFVCLEAKDVPGTVVTKPFKLEGSKLQVNVDAQNGEVRVEVLDVSGKPLSGYSGEDAPLLGYVNELRVEPRWKRKRDLSAFVGQTIGLRFHLRNARLYAFQVLK